MNYERGEISKESTRVVTRRETREARNARDRVCVDRGLTRPTVRDDART